MPFVRMDLLKGRSKEELRRISRSVHQAMTEAIDVPEDDYFQVITQHDEEEFFFDPSYMNIKRTKDLIYIHITMKERPIEKKLAYDPDCAKRKALYPAVKEAFPDYHVMIGGSSSFDAVPARYGKANALRRYMKEQGLSAGQLLYFGDGWQEGGNDRDVYESGIPFIRVDSYRNFGALVQKAGLLP